MRKTWRNRLKIKNNDRFLSNTRGITLLRSIFDVLTINGNIYWKRGRIDLKSKRLNSFLVSLSWLLIIIETSKIQSRIVIPQVLDENQSLCLVLTRFLHVSAMVTNNNRNVKNPVSNCYSSNIRWESIAMFDFNSIPPCLSKDFQ